MNIETSFQLLENLLNAAIKGGVFSNSNDVITLRNAIEFLKQNIKQDEKR